MIKKIIAITLSTIAFTAYADTVLSPKPDNVYSFEISDKLNTIQATSAMAIDKTLLMSCKNQKENDYTSAYSCQINLETAPNFDLNDNNITGVKMLIIPLELEDGVLKSNIVYKQRLDDTHTINSFITDHSLKLNEKNVIKLNDNNDLYITLKKVIY